MVRNIFLSKARTIERRYRERGAKGVLHLLRQKLSGSGDLSFFDQIGKAVVRHLRGNNQRLEVHKKLAEGVSYIVGMAVEGDIAEFGTMTGRSAVALATALDFVNEESYVADELHGIGSRKLWLFDSFEGLPEARFNIDAVSPHVAAGIWGKGTCKGLTPEGLTAVVSRYLKNSEFRVIKGWFKDTVPSIPSGTRFAFVHIDGDLYESALDVLDALFERNMISRGALIYFDDWNCNAGNPRMGERRAWQEMVEKYVVEFSDMGPYGIACNRFMVHDYLPRK
jgi:O-methyltransferase